MERFAGGLIEEHERGYEHEEFSPWNSTAYQSAVNATPSWPAEDDVGDPGGHADG